MDSLFIVAPIVCEGSVFGPCFVLQCNVISSFAIILVRTRELVALISLSWVVCSGLGLQRVILAIPGPEVIKLFSY